MKIIGSPAAATKFGRAAKHPLVLVPTMGALHDGHLALIRRARTLAGDSGSVIVSIFVNPTQFGPKEDLERYPRPFAADLKLCRSHGVSAVFAPAAAQMYSEDHSTYVEETALGNLLCGTSRPGHFCGVCTVVAKLFNIIAPEIAVFGMKDFQQLSVIKRMVRDLNFPVKIVPVETVRESDGLALSSRNRYLSPEERAEAPIIRASLIEARDQVRLGKTDAPSLKRQIVRMISKSALAKIDYVEVFDGDTLEPVRVVGRNTVAAAAVFFGATRLIDNIVLR